MPVAGVRPQLNCATCSKPFWTWPSRVKEGRPSFCSRGCADVWQRRTQVERICGVCSAKFMAKECYVKRGQYLFCSAECRKKSRFTALEERFRQNLGPVTERGCIPWTGYLNPQGYGMISLGGRGSQRVLAHRLAYERANGPIPDGLFALHRCDTPCCVNPDHIFLGTQTDNMADMDAKGRRKAAAGEHHGHAKLTETAVLAIRERRQREGTYYKDLAAEHGVSIRAIRAVLAEQTWKHVTPG